MNIIQAEKLAKELMAQYLDDEWGLEFDNSIKRLGSCWYEKKVITLSKSLIEVNPVEVVKNTILHEIAHVLVGETHGHDSVWAAKHRELGGTGKTHSGIKAAVCNYIGTCPNGHIAHSSGKPRLVYSCNKCYPGGFHPDYIITWKKKRHVYVLSENY